MSNSPVNISSITHLYDKYQTFIFDIWGVIHDGYTLYPGVLKVFEELAQLGKQVVILSNAPRPANIIHNKLALLGLRIDVNSVVTSGGFFIKQLEKNEYPFKGKALVLGEELNKDLLADVNIKRAHSVEEADYMIVLNFANDEKDLSILDDTFKAAFGLSLPLLCPNPDKLVIEQGKTRYTPGSFAARYEDMGGKVFYYGKPHKEIFEYLLKEFNSNKATTIMIGDSLGTDIRGANNAGIDSLLLLTGVHHDEPDIISLLTKYNAVPTYIADGLL